MLTLPKFLAERRVGDRDILAPALVSIMAKLEPRLHSNVRKVMARQPSSRPGESLEQDILEYLSLCYHNTDLKKEEVHLSDHALPVGNMWRWFNFEAAEKAAQLLIRFEMTRSRSSLSGRHVDRLLTIPLKGEVRRSFFIGPKFLSAPN